MAKIVIGVFHDFRAMLNVMPDLVRAGIPREHISAVTQDRSGQYTHRSQASLTGDADIENGVDVSGRFGALLSSTTALSIPGTGFLVAAGPLANAIAGPPADAVTGGFVGALNSIGVLEREARAYEVALREGHLLIIIKTTDVRAVQVMEIFQNHHAVHISMRSPQPVRGERAEFATASSY
jgi:hypothetical protein